MITNIYVVPFQSCFFPVYVESPIVTEQHRPIDYIELCEIYEIGQDYVFCPCQIYCTDNPLLYRVVGVIDILRWDTNGTSYVELKQNNLKNFDMTIDGKIAMSVLTATAFDIEKRYGEQRILDLAIKKQKVLSCRINLTSFFPSEPIINQFEYTDINFLYLQYHFKISLINNVRKDTDTISFSAGKMRYVHDLASNKLSINQEIFPAITNILEEFFIAAHEIYHVKELPRKLYSLIESFFGFVKDEIKIQKLCLENNSLFFSVKHLLFEVNNTTVVCDSKRSKIDDLEKELDSSIYYLQNSFRMYASKKWGFDENCIELQYKEFFKERLWDFPINFDAMEIHYCFDGSRLQIIDDEYSRNKEMVFLPEFWEETIIVDYIVKKCGFLQKKMLINFIDKQEKIAEFSVNNVGYRLEKDKLSIIYDFNVYADEYYMLEKRCWKQYISSQWGFIYEKMQMEEMDYQNKRFVFFYDGKCYRVQKNQLMIM